MVCFLYLFTSQSQNQLTKLFSTTDFESIEERLDCHTVVWWVLTHKSPIKIRHVADQTGPGAVVQAVTWTKCLAVLPRARWGGGDFFFAFSWGVLQAAAKLKCPLATVNS